MMKTLILFFLLAGAITGCARVQQCELSPQLLARVSELRQLNFVEPLECRKANRIALERYVRQRFKQRNASSDLKHEAKAYELIGLVPSERAYRQKVLGTIERRIIAYYDPRRKEYVMSQSLDVKEGELITAHELVHALQDQYYDVSTIFREGLQDDEVLARRALLEGDANVVMNYFTGDFNCSMFDKEEIFASFRRRAAIEGEPSLSKGFSLLMDAPYVFGTGFVCALLEKGGYAQLDASFKELPRSSAEIIFPNRYLKRHEEAAAKVSQQSEDLQRDQGGKHNDPIWQRQMGLLTVFAVLANHLPLEEAYQLTSGLQSEQLELYEPGKQQDDSEQRKSQVIMQWQLVANNNRAASDLHRVLVQIYRPRRSHKLSLNSAKIKLLVFEQTS